MIKRTMRPVGCKVVVKLKKVNTVKEVKSEGGILIEFKSERQVTQEAYATQEARIVSIGPSCDPAYINGAKVGDLVLICKYSGEDKDDIEEGEIYRVINDNDIHVVFEGE